MDEFARIASYFQPLSRRQDGAFALTDDAAVLAVEPGKELVVCADAMVESIHFLPSMPPDRLASKLLRVNLSDLAAMGATPFAYLLTLAIPQGLGDAWLAGFADGLKADQERWSIDLVGGDSTSTDGPISASITAMGMVEPGAILRRSGARVGDDIYVTGTVGDGALGLKAARGDLDGAPTDAVAYLADRYVAPTPRVEIGQALSGLASAAIDVSDGLMADLGHIARESNVGARIRAADVPLSSAAKQVIEFD
ncbi:MAG: thiamine-phosphate kinase, partial [Pseudomonadota bacterium]